MTRQLEKESTQLAALLVALLSVGVLAGERDGDRIQLDRQFASTVSPFLESYCFECHGKNLQEADLDLSVFATTATVAHAHQTWETILTRLDLLEMPPDEAIRLPPPDQRQAVIQWIQSFRRSEATRNAGDPGPLMARRLSNAEYNYTIRDLTGVDIRPTATFPVDPANEAGFDNSGESLVMSPALLDKYLGAARQVVEHLVLKPDGFSFAPHPVVTDTDRDKYCVKRIIKFYERQPVDYADYFLAAWRFRTGDTSADSTSSLVDWAGAGNVSAKYLATIWSALTDPQEDVGPTAKLQQMWRDLPNDPNEVSAARIGCEAMRDFVVELRRKLEPRFENLAIQGSNKGSQPFVLWKNRQYAAHRRKYDRGALHALDGQQSRQQAIADLPADFTGPASEKQRARIEAAFARFCAIFPDAFFVSERGRDYLDKPREQQEKGRLLSAGFHSMMGYFRDDGPLYDLVLESAEQRELDRLWQELDFITSAPMRQYAGFLWFERTDSRFMRDPEFDFARAEDKQATSEEMIQRLSKVYLAKARRVGGGDVEIEAVQEYFRNINAQIRWVENARRAAEPSHLDALLDFAARAYRRELMQTERDELLAFYRSLREQDGLAHEEALQDTIVFVLLSPLFCFRMDLATSGEDRLALSNYELANRLSYFLWSSMPDQPLLDQAANGQLHRPEVLVAATRRMLRDNRVRGMATEFVGNWLDFRRFTQHNAVDRQRFPEFTDELRQAMFEEPIRFFVHVAQQDRPVLDLLYGDYTFVNSALATHYGMPDLENDGAEWYRMDDASRYQRGGLLPMSVFLTKNSPGLRTSPVKRGYWVVRRVLGERIPPPPPNVPELPEDESKLGDLTLREVLSRHREHKSCAGCHDRFDSIGLVFESFGPIGERRTKDLGGRAVITAATFPDGRQWHGLDGLRHYLREHRQDEFLDNLCRKLLSYALGRTLRLSDDPLVDKLLDKLAADGYRFGSLVEQIVSSPQFLYKRGHGPPIQGQ